MSAVLAATIGAVLVAPFVWSALVSLTRRAARGPLNDAHEKAILALMIAPLGIGAAFLFLPSEALSTIPLPLLAWAELPTQTASTPTSASNVAAPIDWLLIASLAVLAIYAAGAVRYAVPLIVAHARLHQWARAARPAAELSVYLSDHAPTPMAVSRRRVLFPASLIETLSAEQVRLIVAHERHHHARGDVVFYAALAWIDVAFWFNPFVRGQTRNCRLAAELQCDAAVTATAPDMRKAYAQTLLTVLKHSAGDALPCAPAIFSNRAVGEHRMRILQIMKSGGKATKRAPWFVYAAAFALAAPLGIAQLALAQSDDPFMAVEPTPLSAPTTASRMPDRSVFTHRPVEGQFVGAFGQRADPETGEPTFHPGVDIAAPLGAHVFAPAGGRVIRAVSHPDYGNLVEIDHGDGLATRYAHLSAFDVREGDTVQAGQLVGRVGDTGRSTRVQVHIEVWRLDRVWDPANILDLPAAD